MTPIIGLSERRRLPRLGKIHLGIKKFNAKGVEYPVAVDYFVCPPEVQAVFGEKPKELRILIPVEDEEKWCSQYYRCYSRTRGLVCKGDGNTAIRAVDPKTGALAWGTDTKTIIMKEMACEGRKCPDYGVKCKEIMNVQFLLPEVPGIGVWQIDTGSINSILNINSASELIRRLYGRISMIPLTLTIEPQPARTPDGTMKNVYVLNLRTRARLGELMATANKPIDQLLIEAGAQDMPADIEDLPVPDDETPELIIPANQAPPGQAPEPETNQPVQGKPEAGVPPFKPGQQGQDASKNYPKSHTMPIKHAPAPVAREKPGMPGEVILDNIPVARETAQPQTASKINEKAPENMEVVVDTAKGVNEAVLKAELWTKIKKLIESKVVTIAFVAKSFGLIVEELKDPEIRERITLDQLIAFREKWEK